MSEPAGIVMPFAGSTAPQGYLLCDGSAVSRSEYADLFTAIGTTYGAGDGSTTFNVPDLAGKVVIGVSDNHALGSTGGEASHTLTESELPAHVHEVPSHGHENDISATTPELSHSITQPVFKYNKPNAGTVGNYSGSTCITNTANTAGSRSANAVVDSHASANCTMSGAVTNCAAFDTLSFGSSDAHNNMQPYLVIKYLISIGG